MTKELRGKKTEDKKHMGEVIKDMNIYEMKKEIYKLNIKRRKLVDKAKEPILDKETKEEFKKIKEEIKSLKRLNKKYSEIIAFGSVSTETRETLITKRDEVVMNIKKLKVDRKNLLETKGRVPDSDSKALYNKIDILDIKIKKLQLKIDMLISECKLKNDIDKYSEAIACAPGKYPKQHGEVNSDAKREEEGVWVDKKPVSSDKPNKESKESISRMKEKIKLNTRQIRELKKSRELASSDREKEGYAIKISELKKENTSLRKDRELLKTLNSKPKSSVRDSSVRAMKKAYSQDINTDKINLNDLEKLNNRAGLRLSEYAKFILVGRDNSKIIRKMERMMEGIDRRNTEIVALREKIKERKAKHMKDMESIKKKKVTVTEEPLNNNVSGLTLTPVEIGEGSGIYAMSINEKDFETMKKSIESSFSLMANFGEEKSEDSNITEKIQLHSMYGEDGNKGFCKIKTQTGREVYLKDIKEEDINAIEGKPYSALNEEERKHANDFIMRTLAHNRSMYINEATGYLLDSNLYPERLLAKDYNDYTPIDKMQAGHLFSITKNKIVK